MRPAASYFNKLVRYKKACVFTTLLSKRNLYNPQPRLLYPNVTSLRFNDATKKETHRAELNLQALFFTVLGCTIGGMNSNIVEVRNKSGFIVC